MAKTNLGKVVITPKGEYDPSKTYCWLDVVRYNGSSYLARKTISGITPTDGENYILLVAKGDKGEKGDSFEIYKTYQTTYDMNYDFYNVPEGKFVLISSNVEDEDNAKLYVRAENSFNYVTDLSGATGIKGEKGDKGDKGDRGATGGTAEVVQTTGDSTTAVMSQKAVTYIVVPNVLACGNLTLHTDYALNINGKETTPSGMHYKSTEKIPCKAGDVFGYIGRADYAIAAAQFFANDEYIGYVQTTKDQSPTETLEITIPENANYVRFCSYGFSNKVPLQVWKKNTSIGNIPYMEEKIEELIKIQEAKEAINPLYGKSITVNGDSICAGTRYAGGYAGIIGERNNMTVQNIGVGGGTIAAETYAGDVARHWISRTITEMDENADFAILEGGVNDSSLGVELGTISNGYNSEFDDTTFIGALESAFRQLTIKFAGKKYGYIFVHQMTANYRVTNVEATSYYWAAKKCCEKWGIPYLDLNISVPPFAFFGSANADLLALKDLYTRHDSSGSGDGWHPNEEGYTKYYVPKIEAWLKTL